MADINLIKDVVAHIEKNASKLKRFDMADFYRPFRTVDETIGQSVCGTAMCFAGWAMDHMLGSQLLQQQRMQGDLVISFAATDYLKLTAEQANDIFYSCEVRTIPQLKHLLNKVLGEEIFPEWEVDDQYDDGYGDE